ncbi:MAG: toll/interleukin-1 receptor domain-containing protein [Spirochaetales bacterium]|nr:toll/interleukin-1 receptor domain-containing protein [Spirochaetales bacterium]
MVEKYDVFISYSHKDNTIAEYFHERLNRAGVRCFMAELDITLGSDFKNKIMEALKFSKLILFIITPNSNTSNWVQIEAGIALGLEKRIIIGRMFIQANEMIDILQSLQSCEIPGPTEQDALIDQIIEMIDFSAFWRFLINERNRSENTYVLLSAKPSVEFEQGKPTGKTGHTITVSYNEFSAMVNLEQELDLLRNKLKIIHGGVFMPGKNGSGELIIPDFPKYANLILIGSTHANIICNEIMGVLKESGLPFVYGVINEGEQSEKCIESRQGMKYPAQIQKSRHIDSGDPMQLDEDYGIILRVTNPFPGGEKNKVLILGGNHGLGTEACIKFVTNRDLIKFLREKTEDNDFEALFKVDLRQEHRQHDERNFFKTDYHDDKKLDLQFLHIYKHEEGHWNQVYSSV